jgi:hypothetical protein
MNDLEFMSNHSKWPRTAGGAPYCCLTKELGDDKREHGFLLQGKPLLYLGYIFNGDMDRFKQFESMQEIFDEGWRVD